MDFGAVVLRVTGFEDESVFKKECNVVEKEYLSMASKSLLLPGNQPKKTISQLSIVKKKQPLDFKNNLFKIDEAEEEEGIKTSRNLPHYQPNINIETMALDNFGRY